MVRDCHSNRWWLEFLLSIISLEIDSWNKMIDCQNELGWMKIIMKYDASSQQKKKPNGTWSRKISKCSIHNICSEFV